MADNELYNVDDVINYQIFSLNGYKQPLEYEDLYQIAYMGYLKAQKYHDSTYGKMSLTYASKCIRQSLITALKKEYTKASMLRIKNNNELNEVENYPDEIEENVTTHRVLSLIERSLPKLGELQAEIIKEYYLDKHPKRLVDLARKKGLSKQRIHQLKEDGIEKLKVILKNEEIDL